MECAHHRNGTFSLADLYAAFWLFVFVRIPLLETLRLSDRPFQNRYFPMTYLLWELGGQCSISFPGGKMLTVTHLTTVDYHPNFPTAVSVIQTRPVNHC